MAGALARLRRDRDPNVRKAAIESLGRIGGPLAAETARFLLGDGEWFVRAHAARALGDLRRADLAADVAPLLADPQWWVRAAAKDALVAMGTAVTPVVESLLDHPDRFARNGAAEVLQNLGVLDELADVAADAPLLRRAAAAGGARLAESLVARTRPDVSARIRRLLDGPEGVPTA